MVYKTVEVMEKVMKARKYCDICGDEIDINLACNIARCECCKKDLCINCVGHEESTHGDYRVVFCQNCWGVGESYRIEIEILNTKIDQLYQEWQNNCEEIC